MTTTVTLTGTGVPMPAPGRAGPGALVRFDDIALQFDAGRATTQRLVDLGVDPHALTAMFVTHVHSDHVVDLPDVAITRWLQQSPANADEEHAFASDVRDGGYTGRVTVGSDLYSVDVVAAAQEARSVV